MKTTVRENRLLVVSDVHMGNRLHRSGRAFRDFVQFALDHRYSICINGDGIDLAQLSLSHLVADLMPSLGLFLRFGESDLRIYYTVGNHDIALEHFLSDIGRMKVVPFITVRSGDQSIRVEHGHMYDNMFLRYPRIYFAFTWIGGLAILIGPRAYHAMHRFNHGFVAFSEWVLSGFGLVKSRKPAKRIGGIEGERECFTAGAEATGLRGFDAVVFGHTHFPGTYMLTDGPRYYNTGAWFTNPHCVAIDEGRVWFGPVADLTTKGDPFPMTEDEVVESITGVFPLQRLGLARVRHDDGVAALER
jgi:UDP-2,3-diacylglucosamine pyrophosphatase LpxH